MELRQLRAFVKAAETLNFTEAAKALCVTQSSFSQSIKSLEEELDVTLFHRNSHEVTLSQAGTELLPFARQTLQQADNCVNRMNDLLNLRAGTLNIGVTHSFSLLMNETIMLFLKTYPGIKLNIFYKTMGELMDMLVKRELDFALSFKPTVSYPQIESHMLFDDCLSAIVTKDHPLARHSSVTIRCLAEYPIVLPSKGLQARNTLDAILCRSNMEITALMEMNSVNPLLRLVRNSKFVTVLSSASIETYPELCAIPIDEPEATMTGSFHILKESYKKEATKEFIRMLCETNAIKDKLHSWIDG